jgi:integrase
MNTAKVIFFLKPDKVKAETGEKPIYCRITVNGKRSHLSINRWIHPKHWIETNQLQNARRKEDKELYFYIESVRSRIKEIERELLEKRLPINSESIKNAFSGKIRKSKSLVELFEWHNKRFQTWVENEDKSPKTLEKYVRVLKHLKKFMKDEYKKEDVYLDELDHSFIENFDYYLRKGRVDDRGFTNRCNNNSTVKYIRNFKTVIKQAVKQGWLKHDIFSKYDGKVKEVKRQCLTMREIHQLSQKEITNPRLSLIRDLFLFAVYTGYSYADVRKLTYSDLRFEENKLWILTERLKTKIEENVLVLVPARQLIDKYKNHHKRQQDLLFPMPSNQKVNAYLKELADICGITKNLTYHIARHTFATTIMLGNDVSMETVMKAMGHKHIKQTQHYGKITDKKVGREMSSLDEKLTKKTG